MDDFSLNLNKLLGDLSKGLDDNPEAQSKIAQIKLMMLVDPLRATVAVYGIMAVALLNRAGGRVTLTPSEWLAATRSIALIVGCHDGSMKGEVLDADSST